MGQGAPAPGAPPSYATAICIVFPLPIRFSLFLATIRSVDTVPAVSMVQLFPLFLLLLYGSQLYSVQSYSSYSVQSYTVPI